MKSRPTKNMLFLSIAVSLSAAVFLAGCPVADIVRVSSDVGGGTNRNLNTGMSLSDLTNDHFDDGSSMGGRISAVANYSNEYVLFGTEPSGFFGHGESFCVAPRTAALNLTDVAIVYTGPAPSQPTPILIDILGIIIPAPANIFLIVPGDTPIPTYRFVAEHQNVNDRFWSYMGAVSAEYCVGRPGNVAYSVQGGVSTIRRGTQGTIDLDAY